MRKLSSSHPAVSFIFQFMKKVSLQAASKPGFPHALSLSYNLISKERLKWSETDQSLIYRYNFDENSHVGKPTVGLLIAIMDELDADNCIGLGRPSAPGASLHMRLKLCSTSNVSGINNSNQQQRQHSPFLPLENLGELEIVSTVVKLGRMVSFVKTDFRNPNNQQLIAYGSHIKFMPTGNWIKDVIFNQKWAWNLYHKFHANVDPKHCQYKQKNLLQDVIGTCLRYKSAGVASFQMNDEHTNLFGYLHVSITLAFLSVCNNPPHSKDSCTTQQGFLELEIFIVSSCIHIRS